VIGPGLLVAATGVGAGDLATSALTGSRLGTAVLWAVLVGALMKYVLTEGLARWQLATGSTVLEGAVRHLGRPVAWVFLPYLAFWSFCVASALMSACGVAFHALIPVMEDAPAAKVVFGALHGAAGAALVLAGGFRAFERVMAACVALMTLTVVVTAFALAPDPEALLRGLVPSAATLGGPALGWTVALVGGVGGTVTILCYGYWIREQGRRGLGDLWTCRLDLGADTRRQRLVRDHLQVVVERIVATGVVHVVMGIHDL